MECGGKLPNGNHAVVLTGTWWNVHNSEFLGCLDKNDSYYVIMELSRTCWNARKWSRIFWNGEEWHVK